MIGDSLEIRKLKVKIYLVVIRPVLIHGAEYFVDRKKEEEAEESWLETTKIRMLRRLRGVSLRNLMRMRIEDTGRKLRVEIIAYTRPGNNNA